MPVKVFFILNALIWTSYSLVCLFAPGLLAGEVVEGLVVFDQTGWVEKVEVRAMYGGAQLAIGLFAIVVLCNLQQHRRTALWFYVLLFAGLAFARLGGLIIDAPAEGLALSFGEAVKPESYNSGALWCFELPMFIYATFLLFTTSE
jgi:hypothetical protein